MGKLFGYEIENSSHYIFYIFGFKLSFLKPYIKEIDKKYNKYTKAEEIPKADGLLREIQLANLSLLKQFNKICKENNLTYWLDFGTLLGAIRHKGFIPWDDDIDIGMPREDYEKMIRIIEATPQMYIELSSNYRNKCYATVKHILTNKTFIDVFPYDFYNSKTTTKEKEKLHKYITKIINQLKFTPFGIKDNEKLRKKFAKITKEKILKNKSQTKETIFWGIDFPHARWKNRIYDYENIFPIKEQLFEDFNFPCPNDPDFVLKNIYGNYMEIPQNTYPKHTHLQGIDKNIQKRLKILINAGAKCDE